VLMSAVSFFPRLFCLKKRRMAPLSCTRCNLNFRTKALLTAHNRTKRHREMAEDEEAETDEEVEEGAEGHEEEEETQEEETESSEEEDEEEEPRPKKKRRIEKRKSSKKKKRPSKKNRGHKRRRRSSPSSSDSSSNSSSSSSDSSESESSSESSDEGGLLDRNEVIRKLIPRSWPKKKTGLDAAFAATEEEIREPEEEEKNPILPPKLFLSILQNSTSVLFLQKKLKDAFAPSWKSSRTRRLSASCARPSPRPGATARPRHTARVSVAGRGQEAGEPIRTNLNRNRKNIEV
jgi:hypothetical protein